MDSFGTQGRVGWRARCPCGRAVDDSTRPSAGLLGCHTLHCLVWCVLHLLLIMLMRDVSCVVKLVMSKILLSKKAWNGNSVPQATTCSGWDLFGVRAFGFGLEPPPRSYGKFTAPLRRLTHSLLRTTYLRFYTRHCSPAVQWRTFRALVGVYT